MSRSASSSRPCRQKGILDDTYIIFSSDNGFFRGEHRIVSGKYLPYDPASRVPLIIRGPGIPAGGASNELVWNGDIPQTILQIAQGSQDNSLDGRSFLPYAENPALRSHAAGAAGGRHRSGRDRCGVGAVEPARGPRWLGCTSPISAASRTSSRSRTRSSRPRTPTALPPIARFEPIDTSTRSTRTADRALRHEAGPGAARIRSPTIRDIATCASGSTTRWSHCRAVPALLPGGARAGPAAALEGGAAEPEKQEAGSGDRDRREPALTEPGQAVAAAAARVTIRRPGALAKLDKAPASKVGDSRFESWVPRSACS